MAEMNIQDICLKLNDHEHEIGSLKHRVDEVERNQVAISELTKSVGELAINMKYMANDQKEIKGRLNDLEKEPGENAKYYKRVIVGCVITTLLGAIIGALIALIII